MSASYLKIATLRLIAVLAVGLLFSNLAVAQINRADITDITTNMQPQGGYTIERVADGVTDITDYGFFGFGGPGSQITFELGKPYDIDGVSIWTGFNNPNQGIKDFIVKLYDGSGGLVASFGPKDMPYDSPAPVIEAIPLARNVERMEMLANTMRQPNVNLIDILEVEFRGVPSSVALPPAPACSAADAAAFNARIQFLQSRSAILFSQLAGLENAHRNNSAAAPLLADVASQRGSLTAFNQGLEAIAAGVGTCGGDADRFELRIGTYEDTLDGFEDRFDDSQNNAGALGTSEAAAADILNTTLSVTDSEFAQLTNKLDALQTRLDECSVASGTAGQDLAELRAEAATVAANIQAVKDTRRSATSDRAALLMVKSDMLSARADTLVAINKADQLVDAFTCIITPGGFNPLWLLIPALLLLLAGMLYARRKRDPDAGENPDPKDQSVAPQLSRSSAPIPPGGEDGSNSDGNNGNDDGAGGSGHGQNSRAAFERWMGLYGPSIPGRHQNKPEKPPQTGLVFPGSAMVAGGASGAAGSLPAAGQLAAGQLASLSGPFAGLRPAYLATGRIGFAQQGVPTSEDVSFGTGFLVRERYVMTNRHVYEMYKQHLVGDGKDFKGGIEFIAEKDKDESDFYQFDGQEPYLPETIDIAIFRLKRPAENRTPIPTKALDTESLEAREIVVIGYPCPSRITEEIAASVEEDPVFAVKRLSTGAIFRHSSDTDTPFGVEAAVSPIINPTGTMRAVCHNASTTGGSSGSPVLDKNGHDLLGVHFGFDVAFDWAEAANFAVAIEDVMKKLDSEEAFE